MLILLSVLSGCARQVQTVGTLGEMSRDEFMTALRWKRFGVAAEMMKEEYRENFKQTFTSLQDIHITDVRLSDLRPEDGGRRFTATYEMDYYLLPSIAVKTFRFDQTWVYAEGKDSSPMGFQITTPFPPFP